MFELHKVIIEGGIPAWAAARDIGQCNPIHMTAAATFPMRFLSTPHSRMSIHNNLYRFTNSWPNRDTQPLIA